MKAPSAKCFCLPSETKPSNPLFEVLTVSAGKLTFSFMLTHRVPFGVVEEGGLWRKLTLIFPTHTVTLEAEANSEHLLQDVVLGKYRFIRQRCGDETATPPGTSSSEYSQGELKGLVVKKVTVRVQQDYVF